VVRFLAFALGIFMSWNCWSQESVTIDFTDPANYANGRYIGPYSDWLPNPGPLAINAGGEDCTTYPVFNCEGLTGVKAIYAVLFTSSPSGVKNVSLNLMTGLQNPNFAEVELIVGCISAIPICNDYCTITGLSDIDRMPSSSSTVTINCPWPIESIDFQGQSVVATSMTFSPGVLSPRNIDLILTKSEVLPKLPKASSSDYQTVVTAQLNGPPSQIAGKMIHFFPRGVDNSGGHLHSAGSHPTGTPQSWTCVTDVNGFCSSPTAYSASEFGGMETIFAELVEDPSIRTFKNLNVKFPDGQLIEVTSDVTFRLTGSNPNQVANPSHPLNHYMTVAAAGNAIMLAGDFYDASNALLGFNDMSLPRGGLFDIGGDWTTPHISHRKGTSLDIEQCALSNIINDPRSGSAVFGWDGNKVKNCQPGFVPVPKPKIRKLCMNHGGHIVPEPTIHCEFSN